MKKFLVLTAFVLAALIAAGCVLVSSPARSQDEIGWDVRTLAGDESAARGFSVSMDTAGPECLEWHTDYPIGGAPDTGFDFSFGGVSYTGYKRDAGIYFSTSLNTGISSTNEITMEDILNNSFGTAVAADAIAAAISAAAGKSCTVRLRLCDYYEYYPLGISVSIDGVLVSTPEGYLDSVWTEDDCFRQALRRAFRIPVPENVYLDVALGYTAGALTDITTQMSDNGDVYISSSAVETPEGVYFAVHAEYSGERADEPDTSLFPGGGEGIFFVPVRSLKEGRVLDETGLCNVYPLEGGAALIGLDADETALLLVQRAYLQTRLDVIDRAESKLSRSILLGKGEDVYLERTLTSDGLRVYVFSDRSFTAVCGENGKYSVVLTGELPETLYLDYTFADAAWDGNRLAIGSVMTYYEDENGMRTSYRQYCTDFTVAVFSDEGTLFYGEYYSSLDAQPRQAELYPYNKLCRTMAFSLESGRRM